jgi:hypothetical protein
LSRDRATAVRARAAADHRARPADLPPRPRHDDAILMTQRAVFPLLSGIYLDFWTSAYQAIDD